MKKDTLILFFALILASCVSAPPQYTSTVKDTYNDGAVAVSFVGLAPAGSGAPDGLTVECANTSANPVTVKWEKSTLTLDGAMQPVSLEDQGSLDAVIPASSRLDATVYPAKDAETSGGGWGPTKTYHRPLTAAQISLSVCVSVNGEDRFYTLVLSEKKPAPPEPRAGGMSGMHGM